MARITLSFLYPRPGHGLIRAVVNDGKAATVGRYSQVGDKKWSARLYARPGAHKAVVAELIATSEEQIRAAVWNRLRQGKWWQ
jgi:hypothetical protein